MIRYKLIEYRANRSQDEMGNMYGVSQQSWSNWERGVKNPSPLIMKRMEMDSGIPMEELFFDIFNNYKLLNNQHNQKAV